MSQVSIDDDALLEIDKLANVAEVRRHQVVNAAVWEYIDRHRIIGQDPYQTAALRYSFKEKAVNK